jgi:hypothetical protein
MLPVFLEKISREICDSGGEFFLILDNKFPTNEIRFVHKMKCILFCSYNKKRKQTNKQQPPPVTKNNFTKFNGRQIFTKYSQIDKVQCPFKPFVRSLSKLIFVSFKFIRPFRK